MCEEFHCLPADAIEAIDNDVGGLLFTIIELRNYAKAKEIYDTTPMEKRPKSATIDLVGEIKAGIAKERIQQFEKEQQGT